MKTRDLTFITLLAEHTWSAEVIISEARDPS